MDHGDVDPYKIRHRMSKFFVGGIYAPKRCFEHETSSFLTVLILGLDRSDDSREDRFWVMTGTGEIKNWCLFFPDRRRVDE